MVTTKKLTALDNIDWRWDKGSEEIASGDDRGKDGAKGWILSSKIRVLSIVYTTRKVYMIWSCWFEYVRQWSDGARDIEVVKQSSASSRYSLSRKPIAICGLVECFEDVELKWLYTFTQVDSARPLFKIAEWIRSVSISRYLRNKTWAELYTFRATAKRMMVGIAALCQNGSPP